MCKWEYDNFNEVWVSKCGYKLIINSYSPKENNMKYCPKCGEQLLEIKQFTKEEALKIAKRIDEDKGNNGGVYVDVQELVISIFEYIR